MTMLIFRYNDSENDEIVKDIEDDISKIQELCNIIYEIYQFTWCYTADYSDETERRPPKQSIHSN